jgi:hypothetical protein
MKLKKLLKHSRNRTIWRLLLNNENLLLVEERDLAKREAAFQCYDLATGKKVLSDLQFEEKFWVGVETFLGDIIYFHGYRKPDMPWHQGITAYSVSQKKVVWENKDFVFAFLDDGTLFGMQQQFETTKYYAIDPLTGALRGEQPEDEAVIRHRRSEMNAKADYSRYNFPVQFSTESQPLIEPLLDGLAKPEETVVEYLAMVNMLLVVLQRSKTPTTYDQRLLAIEIPSKKAILQEVLNENQKSVLFDSFFIYNNCLIVIQNKETVLVYTLIN